MKRVFLLVVVVLTVTALAIQATAKTITFGSNFTYSGTAPASTATPWLTTTFDDGGCTGSVLLTLSATNLTGGEFVSDWYLNFAQDSLVNSLVFTAPTKIGSFATPTISLGTNDFKADGDGYYDIRLSFATSANNRFKAGNCISYTISGIAGLTADSFNAVSLSSGGTGPFTNAAHVQNIGSSSASGWVTTSVPEPSSATSIIAVLGMLSSGMILRRRKS